MSELLVTYLNDHLMGATAGVELFRHAAAHQPALAPLAQEVEEDRDALVRLLEAVGGRPDQVKVVAGWVGEKVARLKPNGSLLGRSPLTDVVELESLTLGVLGKLAGWRLLRSLGDPRLDPAELDRLVDRAERQAEQLDALRLERGGQVLRRASGAA